MKWCIKTIGTSEWWAVGFVPSCSLLKVRQKVRGWLLQTQDGDFRDGVIVLSSVTDFSPVSLSSSLCFDSPCRKEEFAITFSLSQFLTCLLVKDSDTLTPPACFHCYLIQQHFRVEITHWFALCLVCWLLISPGVLGRYLDTNKFNGNNCVMYKSAEP